MWFLREASGKLRGILIIYVDDLGVFATAEVAEALVSAIKAKWKTSEPTWTKDQEAVTLCGVEVSKTGKGWRVSPGKCLKELLTRYGIRDTAPSPLMKWEDPELEELTPETVREAQGITGAPFVDGYPEPARLDVCGVKDGSVDDQGAGSG